MAGLFEVGVEDDDCDVEGLNYGRGTFLCSLNS